MSSTCHAAALFGMGLPGVLDVIRALRRQRRTDISSMNPRQIAPRQLALFSAGAFVFLYEHLFFSPTLPFWIGGDQSVYLVNATRMLHGEIMYRDFFHFLLPGTELVYLVFFALFGVREWVPNAVLIVLGLTLLGLTVAISKNVLKGYAAFLPPLLFLTMAYRNMLNGTHHWFCTATILGALAVAMPRRTPARLAGAGILCGLAVDFTTFQGMLVAFGFGVFLCLEGWGREAVVVLGKKVLTLAASFLGSVMAANIYFAVRAAPGMFWYSTVTFCMRYYRADMDANSWRVYLAGWPSVPPWRHVPLFASWLLIYALLPMVYLIFLKLYARRASTLEQEVWQSLMLLSIIGLSMCVAVAPAPNFFRLFAISPPAFIVLVWMLGEARCRKVLLGIFWTFGILLALTEPWSNHRGWHGLLDFPSGVTAFVSQPQYEKYYWMLHHTRPAEYFFAACRLPDFYFPLQMRNPAQVPLLTTTDYTRPEQVQDVVESLERYKVRLVYWSSNLDSPEDASGAGDHLGPLRAYLLDHYHVIKTFSDDDSVWERRE